MLTLSHSFSKLAQFHLLLNIKLKQFRKPGYNNPCAKFKLLGQPHAVVPVVKQDGAIRLFSD